MVSPSPSLNEITINPCRKIREYATRYDQWARVRQIDPVISDEVHICSNCSTEYNGKFCPQCGLKASISRMKFKNLFLNFLDIWGFGSRPMFRTIKNLFTRPGYMLRDYLTGHQPLYFPPFKMLVVIIIVYLTLSWLFDANLTHQFSLTELARQIQGPLMGKDLKILTYLDKVLFWFYDHLALAVLVFQVFSVLATRIAFRRCKIQWTVVELFFVHIYLAAQYYILEIASILTLGNDIDDAKHGTIYAIISVVYIWLTHMQLYDIGPWKTVGLLIYKLIWYAIILFITVITPIVIAALI